MIVDVVSDGMGVVVPFVARERKRERFVKLLNPRHTSRAL
jgi:hypothetical protein